MENTPLDLGDFTRRLSASAEAIRNLVRDVPPDVARWRPGRGKWSIVEVVNHLLDEEREDFRARLAFLLHGSEGDWPGIDPEGWVTERGYNERDLAESLDHFIEERGRSLSWLTALQNPDWEAEYVHPKLGELCAGDLFVSWVAHDLLHLRQLAKLHYERLVSLGEPFTADYAGEL